MRKRTLFHNGKNDIIKYVAIAVLVVIVLVLILRQSGSEEGAQQAGSEGGSQQTNSFEVETTQMSEVETTEAIQTETTETEEAEEITEAEESAEASDEPEEEEYTFRNNKLLEEHYEKHGEDMGFESAEDYEEAASDVVTNPEALHKTEKEDGDYCYYLEDTNEFVVVSTDGYIRTYFYPSSGKKYYDNQ